MWVRLHGYNSHGRRPVRVRLHGRRLWLNPGNPYAFTVAEHATFNGGLGATVLELHAALGRPLRIVDVGAAIGDTVVMLHFRCPGAIAAYLSVDGDRAFTPYFNLNTAGIPGVSHVETMLADGVAQIPDLVRLHPGTAMAAGAGQVEATSLDRVLADHPERWDLLKTDVDGFDGEVLAGARRWLTASAPPVYFEWHPRLIRAARKDPLHPFDVLHSAGYRNFLWFGNSGPFSHYSGPPDREALGRTADALAADLSAQDPHFDVLALPLAQEHLAQKIAARAGAS